jgi:hypothetical protein
MERYSDQVRTRDGRGIRNATVTVRDSSGALATLYSDNGVTPLANPLTTGADGEYSFCAANGRYMVTTSAGGYTGDASEIGPLFDPADSGLLTVEAYGAGHGGDDTAAFGLAARSVPAAVNIVGAEGSGMPRALMCRVTVPAGSYTLTAEVDTGGREVVWVLDQAAVVSGYQYLNGKIVREGQRQNDSHHGTTDYACGYSIRANTDLEDGAEVLGVTSPTQLATYTDRDTVGLYVDNAAPAALVDAATASYTSTTVTVAAPSATVLRRYRRGMIVDTKHGTPWSGVVDSWSTDGSVLTVTGWYQWGGGGAASTPTGTTGCTVNGFTKAWAHNANVYLTATSVAKRATGFELGVVNNRGALDFGNQENYIWGFDAVNLGTYEGAIAFIARPGSARFFRGFQCNGATQYGFVVIDAGANNPQGGFVSEATTGRPFDFTPGGVRKFSVNSDGSVTTTASVTAQSFVASTAQVASETVGDAATVGTPFIDFNSSGNPVDYDVRLIASGGTASAGNGLLEVYAGTMRLRAAASVDVYAVMRPNADNAQSLGQAAQRWATGYITNLRPGNGTVTWTSGAGSPEGNVTAAVGSMFTRTDGGAGSTLYVKESGSGSTGWAPK